MASKDELAYGDLRNLVPRLARTFRIAPPLQGGGQGFESPLLYSGKPLIQQNSRAGASPM